LIDLSGFPGLVLSLLLTGGPLPLMLAGSLLVPLAWALLARRLDGGPEAEAESVRDRLWLRIVGGAALGEVSVYVAAAILAVIATGNAYPLLVPFLLPAPLLLGTIVGGLCGAASAHRHWRAEGVVAYLGLAFLSLGFLRYTWATLGSTPVGLAWGLALFLLATELFGLVLLLLYQFYALEFLAGRPRRAMRPPASAAAAGPPPVVAVQVACFNEPFPLVEQCLRAIRALDYPADRLWVQLLDDSTDSRSAGSLADLCRTLGIEYRHRERRRGFKAGALNDGLAALPREAEFIAVVDADYVVAPSFLRSALPYFQNPDVAWVQTPQDYRNAGDSAFTRLYSLADAYFYRVIQPVRHDANSSIFCGTMGLLRRRAVEAAGGWDEGCITEDAELSLRLYAAGWSSVYLPEALGTGLAPDRFPALRSQFSRWAFGGLQMLRRDWAALRSPRLTFRQRLDFLASGAFWMDGVFLVAMAGALVTLLVGALTGLAGAMPPPGLLVGISLAPVLLVVDGLVKTRLALGRVHRLDLRDALGVLGFWYALKLTNLRASLRGLAGSSMTFARTPKGRPSGEPATWFSLLRPTVAELAVAVSIAIAAGIAAFAAAPRSTWGGFGRLVLIAWLGYYAVTFGAAPILSLVVRRPSTAPRSEESPGRTAGWPPENPS
jgi:cellulose synthase/poly-beta-1,6-N-acetylglucosamine synthase-like glycosyltransferase